MLCPQTPTLKRKSSQKRIIISSPSQELLRFLTLPNPSANQDPRQRLHILTPKSKPRSVSISQQHAKKIQNHKAKPSAQSRITFIRKKTMNQSWGKKDIEVRQNKLILSNSYKRQMYGKKDISQSMTTNDSLRLDFTFGFNQSPLLLKV